MLVDPRRGDAEDDVAAPTSRSLAAIAGGLLAEVSPAKLAAALGALVVFPALVIGFAPLLATAWLDKVSAKLRAVSEVGSLLLLALLFAGAWFASGGLRRVVESNFWSLNSVLVMPTYVLLREGLLHISGAGGRFRAAWPALAAGLLLAALTVLFAVWLWPATRWLGVPADLIRPDRFVTPALANAAVVVAAYAAVAALAWGVADSLAEPPEELATFDAPLPGRRVIRIALLADVHVVGERYGFRIESGGGGPQGNRRFEAALALLAEIHASGPLDAVVFAGDMTDAGRSAEWAEFLDALARYPVLARLSVMVPGNHDLNVVDRANPARLDVPWSAAKQLRRVRLLSAMDAIQGGRVLVEGTTPSARPGTLRDLLDTHREKLRSFAAAGGWRGMARVKALWLEAFPQHVPPDGADGVGLLLLDSNASTHFSFTNALGLVSAEQARGLERVLARHPGVPWVVVMHHHLVNYPGRKEAFAVKIGTVLANGKSVVRQLSRHSARVAVMHGHRHVDWIGRSGAVRIISAPSPVMGAPDNQSSHFLIHRFQADAGRLRVLRPERVAVCGVSGE